MVSETKNFKPQKEENGALELPLLVERRCFLSIQKPFYMLKNVNLSISSIVFSDRADPDLVINRLLSFGMDLRCNY